MKHTLLVLAVLISGILSAQNYYLELTKDYQTLFQPKHNQEIDYGLYMSGWENADHQADSHTYKMLKDSFNDEVSSSYQHWISSQYNTELYIFHSHGDVNTFSELKGFVVDNMLVDKPCLTKYRKRGYSAWLYCVGEEGSVIILVYDS